MKRSKAGQQPLGCSEGKGEDQRQMVWDEIQNKTKNRSNSSTRNRRARGTDNQAVRHSGHAALRSCGTQVMRHSGHAALRSCGTQAQPIRDAMATPFNGSNRRAGRKGSNLSLHDSPVAP
ncbi:unnamed protein product [Nesidiocoris tenuis]|uniref:Uncharacterized protein n=1 Tax=Nesidiocoris tenuis TaxID=355587 RepID=A0A6H5GDK2_9HEMI|nr:unnamed protein product [Nesidiocoris tenuis]